jgi:MraZ protein
MISTDKKIYTGQYRHTLDNKQRLSIPASFRKMLGEGEVYLATPNPGGFISVLPPAATAQLQEQFAKVPRHDTESREGIAWFSSMSSDLKFDESGRVALSDELREFAGIKKDVVIVGELTEFSIYDREMWEQVEARRKQSGQLTAFMRKHNI